MCRPACRAGSLTPGSQIAYQKQLIERLNRREAGGIAIHVADEPVPTAGRLNITVKVMADDPSSADGEAGAFGESRRLRELCDRVERVSSGTGVSVECQWRYLTTQ